MAAAAAASVTWFLQYWLVKQPLILNFSWNPPHTPFSSLPFLSLSLLSYLSFSLLLPFLPLPPLPSHYLKPISSFHSLSLLLLSLLMSLSTTLSLLSFPHSTICFPPHTKPNGPLFFWAYIFYLSKFLELFDTLIILLSRNFRRLSFLHLYHHSTVLIMSYLWLHTRQSLFPLALITNSSVHVIMYSYYFITSFGIRPRWKRLVTDCQILQFLFSFAVSLLMLYYHFSGVGCSGIWGWFFNALFNASLLALFLDFHLNTYAHRNKIQLPVKTD